MASSMNLADVIDAIATMEGVAGGIEAEATANYGKFTGLPAKISLNADGRTAELLDALSYTSADGVNWLVPRGAWLDGASIPPVFWPIIGSPYVGKYREGSIVHDHYCITHTRPWRDTHRMFYTAMLCRGVSGFKARIMFYAVYRFGPRWQVEAEFAEATFAPPEPVNDEVAASIEADAQALRKQNLRLEDIERLADSSSNRM